MNNSTQNYQNLYGEEPVFLTKGEKPSHYLGYFDTSPELMNQALSIIKKTANSYYGKFKTLFKNSGYSAEDLENEIHLKLLHKFKEQENSFWVETLGNLKTISSFTLTKLIRILLQENKPLTSPMSTYTKDYEDESEDNKNKESLIFKDENSEEEITNNLIMEEFYNGFIDFLTYETEKTSDGNFKYITKSVDGKYERVPRKKQCTQYATILKYNLYLNQKIDLGLSSEEIYLLDKLFSGLKSDEETDQLRKEGKKVSSSDIVTVRELMRTLKINGQYKSYLKEIEDYMTMYGLEPEKYKTEINDQRKILKGSNLDKLTDEDIERISNRGGIVRDGRIVGLTEEVRRLNNLEKQRSKPEKPEYRYREVNLRIIKQKIPRNKQEKLAIKQEKRSWMAV